MSGALNSTFLNNLANPPAANPQYWGQQMQNMNALQDYNAKQATADVYRQSIDPTTGQVDPAKFNLLLSHGAGAWNAGPAMQQQGQAQGAQAVGSADQVAGRLAQLKVMTGEMSDLLQSGQPITADMIHARLNSLGQEGILTPTVMNGINADLNSQPPGADLTGWLRNHYATGLSASDALKNVTSQPQTVDQGDRKIVVEGNPNMPGGQRVGTIYQQGQAPPPLGTTVQIQYPDGTTKQVTPDQVQGELGGHPGSRVVPPGSVSSSEAPVNAAGDSATRKAAEGGPPAPNTPGAAVAQRTHDFWISQGYNEAQVAGILAGGPGSESNFNPTVPGDNGTSYGLYQHHAERLAAMQKYFGLSGNQMPNEQQQDQYAAYEISPQGPLAAVGAQLKQATTPAQAAAVWTRGFGVPGDKTEIGRRANGAQRFAGIYAQPQGPQGSQPPQQQPPAQPQGPLAGVQMGGTPPPPPGGSQAPYTGGGFGAALAPGGAANPVVTKGTPIPATRVVGSNVPAYVGAMQAGRQLAAATPMPANALVAGPGAPSSAAPAPAPAPGGWGSTVGSYSFGPAAPPAPAAPVAQPPAQAVPPQAARGAGWSAPPGYVSGIETRQKADIDAYTKDSGAVSAHQNNVNTLQNAYHALQLADTGPGTQNLQAARAFLQSFGIATSATGDQATQWAEAHKYLMDFARTQGGLGGTDLQAQLAQGSNASTDIPKPAALAVVRNNIAKERLAMAQVQEANGSGGYVDHTKNFAPSQDLRAYQADIMPPQELKQIEALKKTNPQAFEKFQTSLDVARKHGLISDEDLAAQNQHIRALGP